MFVLLVPPSTAGASDAVFVLVVPRRTIFLGGGSFGGGGSGGGGTRGGGGGGFCPAPLGSCTGGGGGGCEREDGSIGGQTTGAKGCELLGQSLLAKGGPYPKAKMGAVLSPSTALPSTTSTCGCCPLWRMQRAQIASPLADVKGKRSRRRGGREVNYDTYAFDLCGPCVRSSHGQAVEPLGGRRRANGGDGKRSSRCGGGGGGTVELLRGGRFAGGLGLGERCQVFQASLQAIKQTNAKDRAGSFREATSRKKLKGSGRGEQGGGTQAKSMRACVYTYNCACVRVCGVHLCFW